MFMPTLWKKKESKGKKLTFFCICYAKIGFFIGRHAEIGYEHKSWTGQESFIYFHKIWKQKRNTSRYTFWSSKGYFPAFKLFSAVNQTGSKYVAYVPVLHFATLEYVDHALQYVGV